MSSIRIWIFILSFASSGHWVSCFQYAGFEPRLTENIYIPLLDPHVVEEGSKCAVSNGCLTLIEEVQETRGTDSVGGFTEKINHFITKSGSRVNFSSRKYGEDELIIYKQTFPDGLKGTSVNDSNGVSTGWPVFQIPDAKDVPGLRFITPGGYMAGWTLYAHGSVQDDLHRFCDGESGGIVIFASQEGSVIPNTIMTAIEEPMTTNVKLDHDTKKLYWGVQGMVQEIPKDFTIQIIVRHDEASINKNVMAWGEVQQKFHASYKIEDTISDYLGYWTDNGATHYYNPLPFNNFEDLLIHIQNYTSENEIPLRYVQLDSWWYYKGEGDGLKKWSAKPSAFPNGIGLVNNVTGWPIVAHNRYFSSDTEYAIQNGGAYEFFIDDATNRSLPLTKKFWDNLFDDAMRWGLSLYEQDWMDRQYELTSILHTNATQGSTWLNQMANSALERKLPIQYCMSFPRQLLHSVTLPAVTQIRVSDDYMLTPDQWRIGASSLFAHSLNLRPYKDVFWSSKQNNQSVFVDCEVTMPGVTFPTFALTHEYNGLVNVTESGKTCLRWRDFGWDKKYPHGGLRENCCRNPLNIKERSFCFTKASVDIPEDQWTWEYCSPPRCEVDCYLLKGENYFGPHNITSSGERCVDWNNELNTTGAFCRNPDGRERPWCYTNTDHTTWEYCDNKCPLASEPNSDLQSAVSTLSTGPVGLGDETVNLDKDLIIKSSRKDGLILKPSRPLTVIDRYFMVSEYVEIWTTESFVSGSSFGIIFMSEVKESFTLTPFELNLNSALSTDFIAWMNYPEVLSGIRKQVAGSSIDLPVGYDQKYQFCLLYTSPIYDLGGSKVAVLGETSKWAPISPQRILSLEASKNVLIVITGVENESVILTFWQDGHVFDIECSFRINGNMTVNYLAQTCV